MEKKNVVFLTVLAVATLLTAVVGTTFAYFTATVKNTNTPSQTSITTASELSITYSDGAAITGTNIVPGWKSVEKEISVTNNSSVAMKYQIAWTDVVNSFEEGTGSTSDLVYSLTDGSGTNKLTTTATTGVLPSGYEKKNGEAYSLTNGKVTVDNGATELSVAAVPDNAASNALLVGETEIAAGATHNYKVRVYFIETGIAQNGNQSSAGTTVAAHCELNGTTVTEVGGAPATSTNCTGEGYSWVESSTTGVKNVQFRATLAASVLANAGIGN